MWRAFSPTSEGRGAYCVELILDDKDFFLQKARNNTTFSFLQDCPICCCNSFVLKLARFGFCQGGAHGEVRQVQRSSLQNYLLLPGQERVIDVNEQILERNFLYFVLIALRLYVCLTNPLFPSQITKPVLQEQTIHYHYQITAKFLKGFQICLLRKKITQHITSFINNQILDFCRH